MIGNIPTYKFYTDPDSVELIAETTFGTGTTAYNETKAHQYACSILMGYMITNGATETNAIDISSQSFLFEYEVTAFTYMKARLEDMDLIIEDNDLYKFGSFPKSLYTKTYNISTIDEDSCNVAQCQNAHYLSSILSMGCQCIEPETNTEFPYELSFELS